MQGTITMVVEKAAFGKLLEIWAVSLYTVSLLRRNPSL